MGVAVIAILPVIYVLAPLLFLCYINDLPEFVSCCCRLYADDVLLYKVIGSDGDCASLQSDLRKKCFYSSLDGIVVG